MGRSVVQNSDSKGKICRNANVGVAGGQSLAEKRLKRKGLQRECSGDQERIPLMSSGDFH